MVSYIIQRVVGMVTVMFLVVTIVFVIVRVAPGDPAAVMLGAEANAADIAELRERLGLERSLVVQYFEFLSSLLRLDLGRSIFLNQPVAEAMLERVEPTLFLSLFSLSIACLIAIPLGIYSAFRRGSVFDQIATSMAMMADSLPNFWLALVLMQIFAVSLGLFPVSGYGGPGTDLATRLAHLALPALTLGIGSSALILRFVRAAMLDVLGDDFIRTARAKGLGEAEVVLKHALKNALVPILTVIGMTAGALLSGAVVTETVFGLPGIGSMVVSAVSRRDYPVIQGTLLVIAAIYVIINFTVDMLYLLVDPRVRY